MVTSLTSPYARWLFLLVVLLVAGTLAFAAGKLWLADHWSQSSDSKDWPRATRLEPGNADYWYRLGRFRHWDFQGADLPQAISHYQRAIQINPRSASYWMDLAAAYEMAGDSNQAQQAFQKALSAYPISAEVAWNYGNFLLRQEQFPEGFAQIHRALTVDPRLLYPAVLVAWQATGDVERILAEVVPPQSRSYFEALDCFLSLRELDPALAVWHRVVALKRSFPIQRAFPLLEQLIQQSRVPDAQHVWQQALSVAGWKTSGPANPSLVWDGGFESELLNGGFGWRELPITGADVDFDTGTDHSGARSLRVTFDGTANLDFQHLVQFVPVEPRSRYRFSAFLRTEGISTDSGIRFLIRNVYPPTEAFVLTPDLVGTQPWSLQEAEFTTGPETRLVLIAVRRVPSRKLDNKLQGTVWVDDVSLVPVREKSVRPSP